jgi:hypothetical protein
MIRCQSHILLLYCHGLCVTIDGVWIGYRIYWPLTRLGTTRNYSTTTNLHNSQITTAPAKPFPAYVFIIRSLVKASNSGDSSDSRDQVLSSQTPVQNYQLTTNLVTPVVFKITPRHGPRRKHRSFSYINSVRGNVFSSPSKGWRNTVY